MLILGVNADDKGSQLEALVGRILDRQGYMKVRLNFVGSGGNELDIRAALETELLGDTQVTPVLGEAKAYASPIDMPTWQKFLGKLFIQRATSPTTVGMLVALNGVNGNVAGSYEALRERDKSLFVFEGSDLVVLATKAGVLGEEDAVARAVLDRFHKPPVGLEPAYYAGAFYWVVQWGSEAYSLVDGHGRMLPAADVEDLRAPCEGSLSGTLLATDEARAAAEARHHARVEVMADLFRGEEVSFTKAGAPGVFGTEARGDGELEALAGLAEEPFCRVENGRLVLLPPDELDAHAVKRLFLSLFEDTVRITLLARFMVERLHEPYIVRLVELLPELQAGFALEASEAASLRDIAVVFPSVWATIANEIPMLVNHRAENSEVTDAIVDSDRTSFWEAIIAAVRSDFSNQRLHGFLYDYMGVAELESRDEFVVKGKGGPIGEPVRIRYRNAVRQFDAASVGQEGPMYVQVRMLPTQDEPWDEEHPEPEFPLDGD